MRAADLYHVGLVADDVDATRDELSELFGYEWAPEISNPTPVCLAGADTTVDLRLVYSRTMPRIEIVRSVPGTVWTPVAGSGIHHMGYWSDDVEGDVAVLTDRGYAAEALGREPGGPTLWAYLHSAGRPRVELVSRAMQGPMEQSWA